MAFKIYKTKSDKPVAVTASDLNKYINKIMMHRLSRSEGLSDVLFVRGPKNPVNRVTFTLQKKKSA